MIIEVCERLRDFCLVPKRDGDGRIIVSHGAVEMEQVPKYCARIAGRTGVWADGTTRDEAVGNLIRTHPEKFGIKLNFLEKQAR